MKTWLVFVLYLQLSTFWQPCNGFCCTLGTVKSHQFKHITMERYNGKMVHFDLCGCNIFGCDCKTSEEGYCLYLAKVYFKDFIEKPNYKAKLIDVFSDSVSEPKSCRKKVLPQTTWYSTR